MLEAYRQHVAERAALGIPPLPLSKQQTAALIELLRNPAGADGAELVQLITHRIPAGVDDAAEIKAKFLAAVAKGEEKNALISRKLATELLGTMLGGYNVKPLIDLLDDAEVGTVAVTALKHTLLMFDYFHDVAELAKTGSANAKAVMQSWADAEWFTSKPELAEKITVTGKKLSDKLYHRFTGHIGNLKTETLAQALERHPERVIEIAVKGMLPKNPLGRAMFKKLKVYKGAEHPHAAQQPQVLDL